MSATPYQGFGYYTGLVSALTGQLKGEAEADRIRRQQEQLAQQNLMKSLQFQQEQEMDAARLDLDERKLQEAVLGRKAKAANGGLTPYQELQERRRQADDEVKIGDMEDALSTINGTEPTMVDGPEIPDSGWFWKDRQQVEAPITVSIRGQPVTGKKQDLAASVQRRIDALRGLSKEDIDALRKEYVRQRPPDVSRSTARKQSQIKFPYPPLVSEGGALPLKTGAAAQGQLETQDIFTPQQRGMLDMAGAVTRMRAGEQDEELQPGEADVSQEPTMQASAGVKAEVLRRLQGKPGSEDNARRLQILAALKARKARSN